MNITFIIPAGADEPQRDRSSGKSPPSRSYCLDPSYLISFDPEKEIAEHKPTSSKLFAFEGDDYIGFIHNKYMRWYSAILHKAYERGPILKPFNRHHPWPRSIPGGTKKFGFVTITLTPREHFDVHWLLTKFTTGRDLYKMRTVLCFSTNRKRLKPCQVAAAMKAAPGYSEETRQIIRQKTREVMNDPVRGPQIKAAISKSLTGRKAGPRSDETKQKIGNAKRGKKISAEHVAKSAAGNRGKVRSAEHKKKISEANIELYRNPAHRQKTVASSKASWTDPVVREKRVSGLKRKWKDPIHHSNVVAGIKRSWQDLARHEKHRVALAGQKRSIESRYKMSIANTFGNRLGRGSMQRVMNVASCEAA